MSRPANQRMRKTARQVAARQVAVRGVREAFPTWTIGEIGAALGITRHMVRHYLLGEIKSGQHAAPAWKESFLEGCRALMTSQPGRAADPFDRLARALYQEGRE